MLSDGFAAMGAACFEYEGVRYWVQEFGRTVSDTPETPALDGEAVSVIEGIAPTPAPVPDGWISIGPEQFPDRSFRALVSRTADRDGDGLLSPEETAAVTELSCAGEGILSLEGLECFSGLQVLDCSDNELADLDLTGLSELGSLRCSGNALTFLDVKPCPKLCEAVYYGSVEDTEDGTVVFCAQGETVPRVVCDRLVPVRASDPADADGDGSVTMTDAVRLIRDGWAAAAALVLHRMLNVA